MECVYIGMRLILAPVCVRVCVGVCVRALHHGHVYSGCLEVCLFAGLDCVLYSAPGAQHRAIDQYPHQPATQPSPQGALSVSN